MMKINLHIIEACNYACKYCFAHYDNHKFLTIKDWKEIIDVCYESKLFNEINFAGGEPLLHPDITYIIDYAYNKGFKCSIITNGMFLTENFIKEYGNKLDTIGISIDSFDEYTLTKLGCCDKTGSVMNFNKFSRIMSMIEKYCFNTKVKINTVVCKENYKENLAADLRNFDIARWKILKMTPFKNDKYDNYDLSISDKQYTDYLIRNFCELGTMYNPDKIKHTAGNMNIITESDMKNSYYMIDAGGFLIINNNENNYTRIADCRKENFAESIQKINNFNDKLYLERY